MATRLPPPQREFSWSRTFRTFSFWALLLVGAVALVQFAANKKQDTADISYSDFAAQLDQQNVATVEITDKQEVKGDFRHNINFKGHDVEHFTSLLPFDATSEWIASLRSKNVDVTAKEPKQSFGVILLNLWPLLLFAAVMIYLIRQMQQGGNRAFAFGKSKAKLLAGDTPKVTFADVAGCDEAKQELEEIIDFLKDPQRFQRLGGRLPKGALLVGPPGTGKTLLAKAVAGEAGRPFFSMSGSDFVEMFVGVGASRVRDLFEQGKAHAPCIIFIDEIDAVGRHRGAGLGGGHDEREQTLNQLLVEMDGFESNDGVILLAATNRPDILDPALLRPGRFDRQIVVDMPDVKGREQILRVHTRKIPLQPNVDLERIARGTPGLSGAELSNVVNEAALLAARRNKQQVENPDLEDAKDKVMLGLERRSMVVTDEERKLTAYHEAGHALVSLYVPGSDPLHKVTIIPRGRALGVTHWLPEEDRHNYTKQYILSRLATAYGGRVAEELVFGADKITTGAAQDIQQATDLARRMITHFGMSDVVGPIAVGDRESEIFLGREVMQRHEVSNKTAELVDQELKVILGNAFERARTILTEHRDQLDRIAAALVERETLDRVEVDMVVAGQTLPPQAPPSTPGAPAPVTPSRTPVAARGPLLGSPPPEPAGA
ncbi:MAG TPA: ATP-dependent zinc metalloprotease FtsH [Gemmatimonadales bacterium]|jgi:cell division protease FtsH|nr:ATP-dependent zinc metalloprotease FtsH [Gemmatimonadales bacterium]